MVKSSWKFDDYANKNSNYAGATKFEANTEFNNKINWIRDHHKGLL